MIGAVDERRLDVRSSGSRRAGPTSITLSMPFSTPGMYSFGTAPPTIFDLELEAFAGLRFGSKTILTRANWPEPPVCFLCV